MKLLVPLALLLSTAASAQTALTRMERARAQQMLKSIKEEIVPDEIILPRAEDMAAQLDPVLVRAAALLGATIDPKAAGAMFPIEWR